MVGAVKEMRKNPIQMIMMMAHIGTVTESRTAVVDLFFLCHVGHRVRFDSGDPPGCFV